MLTVPRVPLRPASRLEKSVYAATPQGPDKLNPLYPLSHMARVDGQWCAVECPGEPDGPKYEAMAPDGHHFDTDEGPLHSVLATDLADLRDRLQGARIVPCSEAAQC